MRLCRRQRNCLMPTGYYCLILPSCHKRLRQSSIKYAWLRYGGDCGIGSSTSVPRLSAAVQSALLNAHTFKYSWVWGADIYVKLLEQSGSRAAVLCTWHSQMSTISNGSILLGASPRSNGRPLVKHDPSTGNNTSGARSTLYPSALYSAS